MVQGMGAGEHMKEEVLSQDLQATRLEQLLRIASALAADVPLATMSAIVGEECRHEMGADAVSVHLRQDDGFYELVFHQGCTAEFTNQWKMVPESIFPHEIEMSSNTFIFFGSAATLKKAIPSASDLLDQSFRKTIAFGPMVVGDAAIGILGFAYNDEHRVAPDRRFMSILVNLCAQALARSRLSEKEKNLLLKAEAANLAKSEFLVNINHEIRTPLNVIGGFADLLVQAPNLTRVQQDWASAIQRNSHHVAELIEGVLDVSRIESERLRIKDSEFSLGELLEDLFNSFRVKAEESGVRFQVDSVPQPHRVISDPLRIRQVLSHVIENAVKFTSRGKISIQIVYQDDLLLVTIKDTGIGISSAMQEKIFEPFQQMDSSLHRRFGGTGLGLPIARRLARVMNGDVKLVRSEPGSGSIFQVLLPLKSLDEHPRASAERGNLGRLLFGRRILIVDDSPDSLALTKNCLDSAGAIVTTADSGLKTLTFAKTTKFDLILLDIQMPEMDGYQTMSRLNLQSYKGKVVALTAHALASERERAMKLGFIDYITKPFTLTSLVERVSALTVDPLSLNRAHKSGGAHSGNLNIKPARLQKQQSRSV
ncbi:MAG: hypothetical protein C5B49_02400 [Bdellovibrio sp.]|nr:MAG: hypothetical protein C5B49_02400 [Bdellovibrio sp.]